MSPTPAPAIRSGKSQVLGGITVTSVEFGFQYDRIPPNEMQSILAAFPPLEMTRRFADSICRIVETKPDTTYTISPGTSASVLCQATSGRQPWIF